MLTVTVHTAAPADRARVISAIVMAFSSDPMTRWTWPEPHAFLTHFPPFVDAFGGRAFDHESAHVLEGYAGASLWLPPGIHPDEERMADLIQGTVAAERASVGAAIMEQMAAFHPDEPHWYLPFIGIDPPMQGRGYGSALLQHMLERVDAEGHVAYLESSNPANVPLYERHGFEVLGTIQVADAPPLIPMLRQRR